jgi:hypothetical protein
MYKRIWAALAFSATFIAAAGGYAQQVISEHVVNGRITVEAADHCLN